jgi:hypothetical protein
MTTPKRTLRERAYQEFKEFLVITLYLWVIFALFLLYKAVILNEEHIDTVAKGFAFLNALALAKVMLVAKALHFGEWADDAPLIYPTLIKSASFAALLALFKVLEEWAVGLYHGKSFQESLTRLPGGTLAGILTLALLLFVMLIPFFGFSELQRVLGEGKLVQLFFDRRQLATLPDGSLPQSN